MKIKIISAIITIITMLTQTTFIVYSEDDKPYDRSKELIGLDSAKEENYGLSGSDARYYSEIPVSSFEVSNLSPDIVTDLDYTDWWYSEWDDCRYIFLPVTADRDSIVITYSADDTIYLNGQPVKSGETTSLLSDDDIFQITVGDKDCGKLKVMQSHIGCIYLSTSHGGTDALDKNCNITETGTTIMLNADGSTEYSGAYEKLTAHGNSSWDYSKKKPYNLKLPQKENLYGMGKAKKWTLLANYLDHSMLRNKLTEEMCKAAGMECVMDSVFVDIYADGSYRGTYQLYERVQIQKNRINIRDLEEVTEKLNSRDLNEYAQKVVGADSAGEYKENSYKYYDIPNNPDDVTGGYLLQFQQWNI
ncbi:CotH kinase family protein [Ruminococcus sp.]|uniref:CotH kinase family protein n=1 Tax=Ruminococcus sp. TaxID=41978 RepID=UPI0025E3234C|nr:CotH kinase family protein [Ruminococcus sp.]